MCYDETVVRTTLYIEAVKPPKSVRLSTVRTVVTCYCPSVYSMRKWVRIELLTYRVHDATSSVDILFGLYSAES